MIQYLTDQTHHLTCVMMSSVSVINLSSQKHFELPWPSELRVRSIFIFIK